MFEFSLSALTAEAETLWKRCGRIEKPGREKGGEEEEEKKDGVYEEEEEERGGWNGMRKLVLRKEEEARDSSSLGCHHVRLGPRVRRVASGTTRFADVAQLARLGLLIPIVRRDS